MEHSKESLYTRFRRHYNQLGRIEKYFLNIYIADTIFYSLLLFSFLVAVSKLRIQNYLHLTIIIFPIISGIITVRDYNIYELKKFSTHLKSNCFTFIVSTTNHTPWDRTS